jgi:hypothetical protein
VKVSRSGAVYFELIPEPTVIVRMKENGTSPGIPAGISFRDPAGCHSCSELSPRLIYKLADNEYEQNP